MEDPQSSKTSCESSVVSNGPPSDSHTVDQTKVVSSSVILGSATSNQSTASPVAETICASSSENPQNYFLVRLMHPKMPVPVLVLSAENDKASMDLRNVINNHIGLRGEKLQHDGQTVTTIPNTGTSFIAIQQCSQQNGLGKSSEKSMDNSLGNSKSKVQIGQVGGDTTELLLMHPASVNIGDPGRLPDFSLRSSVKTPKEKHPPGEKLFICEVEGCGRSFSSMGYLRYHQAVHEGQRSLKCPYDGCNRKFSWPAHLRYHQMTHTGVRNYKCTITGCDKTFYTPQRLSVHLRTHTGERPFVCEEPGCEKSFTTAGNLKNHRRIHTGERPYVCTHQSCGRQFAEYSSLKKHKLTHTGEKPYACDICGKTFSQSGSRKVHMRGHLKIRPSKKQKRQKTTEDTKQNVVVLRQEDILHYQDFQVSESVVFSQAVGDHVVTVTTQPSEGETDQLGLHQGILGTEEVLTSEECIRGDTLCPSNSMGANVVVLSQPQEIVSMTTEFASGERTTQEEIVYGSDLLNSDLDHEEIAHPDLSEDQSMSHHSPVGSTDKQVAMDPMMETDDDSDEDTQVWVEND